MLVDLVDRFSAGARKMAWLSSKLGKGLAGAQAELKQLQAQAGRLDQLRALQSRLGKTAADMAAAKKRAAELEHRAISMSLCFGIPLCVDL